MQYKCVLVLDLEVFQVSALFRSDLLSGSEFFSVLRESHQCPQECQHSAHEVIAVHSLRDGFAV